MKRATAFALFVVLGTTPALAVVHGGGGGGAMSPFETSVATHLHTGAGLGNVRTHESSGLSTTPQGAYGSDRPMQCETTVYTDRGGFFVGQEETYMSYGGCPFLPVTFLDNVAPMPPSTEYRTGLLPMLIPADDFDLFDK